MTDDTATQAQLDALAKLETFDFGTNGFDHASGFPAKHQWKGIGVMAARAFPRMRFAEINTDCSLLEPDFPRTRFSDFGVFQLKDLRPTIIPQEDGRCFARAHF